VIFFQSSNPNLGYEPFGGVGVNLALKMRILEKYRTQADFCQAVSIWPDKLSRIVHERIEPSEDEKQKIARALNCRVGEIFPEEEVQSCQSAVNQPTH